MIEYIKDMPYGQVGELSLRMDMARPVGASNLPGIICLHGGGWYDGKRDDKQISDEIQDFAAAGLIAFSISYRLTSTGIQFSDPYAVGSAYPDAPEDVQTALDHVLSQADAYGVDVTKVVMFGTSAGAHLAVLTAYRNPDVKAAIGWSTPIEMKSMFRTSNQRDRVQLFMGGSPQQVGQALYNEASPLTYFQEAPPTLLVQGTLDATVPQAQAKMLQRALGPISPLSQFKFISGASHSLQGHRDEAMTYSQNFLQNIL